MAPRPLTILILVLLGFAALGIFVFVNFGTWLLVSDPEPAKIDLIMTFAGYENRFDRSIELLKKHPEARWLASTKSRGWVINQCAKAGIDTSRVTTVGPCKSTWDEVRALKEYLATNPHAQSVGLVSSEWHMRRIMLTIFRQGVRKASFACLPVPLEISGPKRSAFKTWRKTRMTQFIVASETVKMVYYMLGLRGSS